jgi:superfamily II DNA or RNA helicase
MTDTIHASDALAPRYPMACTPEDCASSSGATQKMLTAKAESTPPSQKDGIFAGAVALRPYQANAIQNVRYTLAGPNGVQRVLVYSPTGSGKTEIGMAIVKGAVVKKKRVAFICNRIHLVDQASDRFMKAGIVHGRIQGRNTARIYEQVLIASIQTVAKRGLPPVDLIIIDEAHTAAGSKDYLRILAAANGVTVIGLSATPYSKGLGKHYDELGGALFESMVIAASVAELIADGYLVDCDVYAPSQPDMVGFTERRNAFGEMDYSDADAARAADKPELVGDIVKHWMRLAKGTATVCFASNIAHSKHIVERLRAAGVAAEHLDCYTEEKERKAILQRVKAGETLVISNVGILSEGWDFPACKTLILARPTKSRIRYMQMAGRVLRPHEGKKRALILDHSGTVVRLGFPSDEFPLVLDSDAPNGKQVATKKREAPLPRACPKCSYVSTVHACPVCGFAPKKQPGVDVKDGELVLLKKDKKRRIGKQTFYSQLLAVAASRGYREGWVANKYREYFGSWPRGLQNVAAEPTDVVLKFLTHLQIRYAKSKQVHRARP